MVLFVLFIQFLWWVFCMIARGLLVLFSFIVLAITHRSKAKRAAEPPLAVGRHRIGAHQATALPPTARVADVPTKKSKIVNVFTNKWFEVAAESFIVVDLETTGLDAYTDYIVEMAAIYYEGGMERDRFVSLVKPPVPIPRSAVDVHHITNRMVKDADSIAMVLPGFLQFVGDSLLVGHNVNFDIKFIEIAARRLGYDPCWNYVDTISVAKKIIPGLPDYKQATVVQALGIPQAVAHRAEDDCRACAEILIRGLQLKARGKVP